MMQGILSRANHDIVQDEKNADAIVLNICTVKGDKNALKQVKNVHEQHPGKKIVVAGCITPSIVQQIKNFVPDASLVSTHNIDKIVQATTTKQEFLQRSRKTKIGLPRIRANPTVGIVNIASGCTSACTFCSTKIVKGGIQSYPAQNVLEECEQHLNDGCKELWLTSQDNGCWGVEWNQNLSHLLEFLTNKLRGPFHIRNGMSNPKHVVKFYEELIKAYKHPKIFKFLHLPVQSGSNKILGLMRRQHSVKDFLKTIKRFREEIPELTLATDIIVGFPGETEQDFEQTLQVIEQARPDVINISRFAARPGTPAAKMPEQVHGRESKERSRKVTELFKRIARERNEEWVGWEGDVLVDEQGKNNTMIARNHAYKQVIIPGRRELGEIVRVKIIGATAHDLRAVIV